MKSVLAILIASSLALTASAQDARWYVYGGVSYYDEELVSLVDSGIGPKLGAGFALNEIYSVEASFDQSPALDVAESLGVKFEGNQYLSIMISAEIDLMGDTSLVGKVGYTKYRQEVGIEFGDEKYSNDDYAPKTSIGVKFPFADHISLVVSADQVFGDEAEALSLGCVLRFDF